MGCSIRSFHSLPCAAAKWRDWVSPIMFRLSVSIANALDPPLPPCPHPIGDGIIPTRKRSTSINPSLQLIEISSVHGQLTLSVFPGRHTCSECNTRWTHPSEQHYYNSTRTLTSALKLNPNSASPKRKCMHGCTRVSGIISLSADQLSGRHGDFSHITQFRSSLASD